ncbi:DUF4131 domain-containing protein [Pedobacter sp. HMF7647]|uniref:DUF4131 domain-containing protein n=1 Tax=Hufsiella arboris TaxID=2695275 RepID=A0A7K1YDV6_9SPHI|nr:ComEC/Rec2 family competence protein [Hufsiella arboris]MXV52218.1 DUF4131 domain-containing protein [Hufsiella arboris]
MKPKLIKGEIPFVRLLMPLMAGIACASYFKLSPGNIQLAEVIFCCLFLLFTLSIVFYKSLRLYRFRWISGIILHGIVFFCAQILTSYSEGLHAPNYFSKRKTSALLIRVNSEPNVKEGITRFTADVLEGFEGNSSFALSGKILIAVKTDSAKTFEYGDELLTVSRFSPVEPPYNPNEFDYKNYLANQQLYYQAFFTQNEVKLVRQHQGNKLVEVAINLRKKLVVKYARYIHDADALSVASTLILGYRNDLSREVLDSYSKTGTMHVLSVSGMHVAIVFAVLMFLLRFMDKSQTLRIFRAILIVMSIWFYSIITGFSPSVCRAALMLSFLVIGKSINRKANSYNIIASSAFILLLYNPFYLVDVGFQLSYLAVLGLIYFYPKIQHLIYLKNWFLNEIWKAIALSFAAQLATFPLSVFYFHQFPVCFLVSNLFILLPVTLILYAGLVFLFIPWEPVLTSLGWILEKMIVFTNKGLYWIENIPYANIDGLWIPEWYYLLIFLIILSLTMSFSYQSKGLVYCAFIGLFVLASYQSFSSVTKMNQRRVVIYSLRKNSAMAFMEGNSARVIADVPPEDKTYQFSVKPSLDAAVSKVSFENIANRHFIEFQNWRVFVWDTTFNNKTFSEKLETDVVMLRLNPKVDIADIKRNIAFKLLLIDGSNRDHKIKQWQDEAKSSNCNVYVLKRNKAYLIDY